MRRCYHVKSKDSASEKILNAFIFLSIRNMSFLPFFFLCSALSSFSYCFDISRYVPSLLLEATSVSFFKNPRESMQLPILSAFSTANFFPLTHIHWRFFCVSGAHDPERGIYFKTSQASQYCTSDWGDGHANWVVPRHGTCKGECFGVKLLIVSTILKNSIPTWAYWKTWDHRIM